MGTEVKAIDIYEISDKIQNSSKLIDKKIDDIINIPFYKKIIYRFSKNRQLKELEEAFEFFKLKKDELYGHKNALKELEVVLRNENRELEKHIKRIKSRKNQDTELLVQLETKLVINTEILTNEIPIINDMIENILVKLEKTLPFIERTIKQRLTINTALKTLQFVIEKTIELEEYSKKLERENSQTIKKMVTQSTEMIINSIDIDYYKDMRKRNEELQKLFETSKRKYYKKLERLEKELTGIIEETKDNR